jgi:uroporphyrin-III C-methyltransferase/precorrin-2 dehydrogenase/sirohydrochlorin ferrochelatase
MSGLFPHLPMFLDMAGRAAVLLSGADTLAPLARRLLDAGAGVTALDARPSAAMAALAPPLRLLKRGWRTTDLDGAALVVAGPREARAPQARAAARAAGAIYATQGATPPMELSFGAGAAWGTVAIGVSASGLSDGVGEAIAMRLAAAAPDNYAAFLAAASRVGNEVEVAIANRASRDAFWRDAATDAFDANPSDWEDWIRTRLSRA